MFKKSFVLFLLLFGIQSLASESTFFCKPNGLGRQDYHSLLRFTVINDNDGIRLKKDTFGMRPSLPDFNELKSGAKVSNNPGPGGGWIFQVGQQHGELVWLMVSPAMGNLPITAGLEVFQNETSVGASNFSCVLH